MLKRPGLLALLTLALAACSQQSTTPAPSEIDTQAISGTNIDTWRKQVIYLLIPDRFSNGNTSNDNLGAANCFDPASPTKFHGGDLQGVRNRISYIKSLGATTVWTTPVYKQVGLVNTSCGYHGYWANFTNNPADTSIEPKLGTSSDLTGLINDLHNSTNNMKFMMDMVVNHAGYGATITSTNPTWFHGNCTGNDITCPLAGLPDFAQENSTVATYLTNLSKNWTTQYAIDAIRMDTAKHVPLNYWSSSWIPGINAARPNTFTLAEAFLENDSNQMKPYLDAGFDSTFNFPLRKAIVDSIGKGGSLDLLAGKVQDYVGNLGINRALLQVSFLDNHDVQRFVNEPGFGVAENEIRSRYFMGLGAIFTLPGIPQIYYGDELGVYGGGDPDNRKDMPSWAWTDTGRNATQSGYLAGGGNPKTTFDFIKKLATLRTSNEALWKGGYAEMWRPNGGTNVFAFYRGNNLNNRFVIVINNSASASGNIALNISANTAIPSTDRTYMANRVYDDQAGRGAPATATASGGILNVNLPAKSIAIYKAR